MKIMLVDNEEMLLDFLSLALGRLGHTVYMANNGYHALAELQNCEPDLFLLDVLMPGKDGIQLCEELRADPRFADSPIIMISGFAINDEVVDRAFDSGADDFISKPINLKILERRIDILEWKKQQQP